MVCCTLNFLNFTTNEPDDYKSSKLELLLLHPPPIIISPSSHTNAAPTLKPLYLLETKIVFTEIGGLFHLPVSLLHCSHCFVHKFPLELGEVSFSGSHSENVQFIKLTFPNHILNIQEGRMISKASCGKQWQTVANVLPRGDYTV